MFHLILTATTGGRGCSFSLQKRRSRLRGYISDWPELARGLVVGTDGRQGFCMQCLLTSRLCPLLLSEICATPCLNWGHTLAKCRTCIRTYWYSCQWWKPVFSLSLIAYHECKSRVMWENKTIVHLGHK